MSDSGPFIVPIEVQAMVINNPSVEFLRAEMNYDQLAIYQSPAPVPFESSQGNIGFARNVANRGVYLMWTLPKALRHGQQQAGGGFNFPYVPNRWLVVRLYRPAGTSAPTATAWMVQSDYLAATTGAKGTSTYVDPTQKTKLVPTRLGQKVQLSPNAPWTEPTTASPYFLQAVAESNPAFAAYQPFNENVFSFFDDLATHQVGDGTLSYFVLGWYAEAAGQPSADILADGKITFADLLKQLNWQTAFPDLDKTRSTTTSLYQGAAYGVPWNPTGKVIPSPKDNPVPQVAVGNTSIDAVVAPSPKHELVPQVAVGNTSIDAVVAPSPKHELVPQVAVGNTSIDAVVAFAQAAFAGQTTPPNGITPQRAVDLLEAFQYNMLPVLNQVGGEARLEQQIRSQWFVSAHAGTRWVITNAPTAPGVAISTPDALALAPEATETTWLTALNTAQTQLDQLTRTLMGMQRRLFELWWKEKVGNLSSHKSADEDWPWNTTQDQFDQAISDLTAQVQKLLVQRDSLALQVPLATATTTLDEAILAFANTKNLPATRLLKAVSEPRFWAPVDPVAVVSGTAHTLKIDPDTPLVCRWPDEVVTSLAVSADTAFSISTAQLTTYQPPVPWTNLPPLAPKLFAEFFLLDPTNAPLVAAAAGQQLSANQLVALAASLAKPQPTSATAQPPSILPPYPWGQPWQPLYLDWEVEWYPIPFQYGGAPNWQFDGLDYRLTSTVKLPSAPVPRTISGRTVLTPKPSFEFKSRLDQFIKDYPNAPTTGALEELIGTVDAWDFLSQRFSGLHAQIAGWNPVPTQLPDDSVANLIAEQAQLPPWPMQADTPRNPTVPPSTFEGLRAGQLCINRLSVVDVFGQSLDVVTAPDPNKGDTVARTANNAVFTPLLADGVAPTGPLPGQTNLTRFVELPPRVLQPARLNFQFTPQANGNPILGWLLPNHLDAGLAVYGPDGTAYGELLLGVDANNLPVLDWLPAPNSPYPQLPPPATSQDPLLGLLAQQQALGTAAFADFLQAVDETLWTVDPLGNRADTFLSVLIGRPLAVVAATLSFELQAEAWRDTDWPYTFASPLPDPLFLNYQFPVRLGELGYRQDGLLGYFEDGNYSTFNAIHLPATGPSEPPLSGYLKLIKPGNYLNLSFGSSIKPGPPANITLLMDPRGSVHAQCGLLPVKEITLLPKWVDTALAAIAVTFRTGPVLVDQQQLTLAGQTQSVPAVLLPRPAEQHGTWSWLESTTTGQWNDLLLAPVDATATLNDTPPTLREGRLKLTGGLDK